MFLMFTLYLNTFKFNNTLEHLELLQNPTYVVLG